jgi:hypothetical protein
MGWRLEKSAVEIKDYAAEMKDSWNRRDWKGRIGHFPVDVFVEAYRRMPYTLGHTSFFGNLALLLYVIFW